MDVVFWDHFGRNFFSDLWGPISNIKVVLLVERAKVGRQGAVGSALLDIWHRLFND